MLRQHAPIHVQPKASTLFLRVLIRPAVRFSNIESPVRTEESSVRVQRLGLVAIAALQWPHTNPITLGLG